MEIAGNTAESIGVDSAAGSELAGKYLTFAMADEAYGVEILKVIEIIGMMHVTPVPDSPSYMKGVINLRGKVIPVIELRTKFSMETVDYDEKTCIIIVNVSVGDEKVAVGMVVDTVLEVKDFEGSLIEPAPEFGVNLDNHFILGIGRLGHDSNEIVILVDIDRILAGGVQQLSTGDNEEAVQA